MAGWPRQGQGRTWRERRKRVQSKRRESSAEIRGDCFMQKADTNLENMDDFLLWLTS